MEGGVVNEESLGPTVLAEGKAPIICDIVFVHGLAGDAFETWTKDKVMWPKDFLPEAIPSARIITWGYDANPINFFDNTSSNRIEDHAMNLLNDLINERDAAEERNRPIIFVGHSLGGLVIKNAICSAHDFQDNGSRPDMVRILESTFGVVFMGTPHKGSAHGNFKTVMADFAKAILQNEDEHLINSLQMGSEITSILANRFIGPANRLQMRTCLEELAYGKVGKIVDDTSAVLHHTNEGVSTIHANHREMVRYATKDHNYKVAMGAIRQIKNLIPTTGPVNAADKINTSLQSTDQRSLQIDGAVEWGMAKADYVQGPRGHLSFTEGDTITHIIRYQGPFWQGQIGDQVGLFPYTYVTLPKANRGASSAATHPQTPTSNQQFAPSYPGAPPFTPEAFATPLPKVSNDIASPPPGEQPPTHYAKMTEAEAVKDAITCEEPNRLRRLLGLGFDVDWTGQARHDLLLEAIDSKNVEIVTIMLERGAFAKNKDWDQALIDHAILSQKAETVELVLERVDVSIASLNFPFAVSNGRLNIVEAFVKKGVDLNFPDRRNGWTPMHHAAAQVTTELALYLLSQGAEVNSRSKIGRTPLHVAIADLRYLDVVKVLVDAGADLHAKDYKDHTPLHLAVRYWNHKKGNPPFGMILTGDVDLLVNGMSYLIDKGSALDTVNYKTDTPLHNAIKCKSLALVKLLVVRGAPLDTAGFNGRTPLDAATWFGKPGSLDILLQAGAAVNLQDKEGWNCLHWAGWANSLEAAQKLIAAGAPMDLKARLATDEKVEQEPEQSTKQTNEGDAEAEQKELPVHLQHPEWGMTALHFAAAHGNLELVKLFVEHGADVNHRALFVTPTGGDKPYVTDGATPFIIAALGRTNEYLDVLRFLHERGADLSVQDNLGGTALHGAARRAPDATVEWLIGEGASVAAVDNDGFTPLAIAVYYDGSPSESTDAFLTTIGMLLDGGADIEARTNAEWQSLTPLHLAVLYGWALKVKFLLERGATIEVVNSYDQTPLQTAAYNGKVEAMQVLLESGAGTAQHQEDRAKALSLAKDNNQTAAAEVLEKFSPIESSEPGQTATTTTSPSAADQGSSSAPVSTQPSASDNNILPPELDEYVEKGKALANRFKKGWKAFLD